MNPLVIVFTRNHDGSFNCKNKKIMKKKKKNVTWKPMIEEFCPDTSYLKELEYKERLFWIVFRCQMWKN